MKRTVLACLFLLAFGRGAAAQETPAAPTAAPPQAATSEERRRDIRRLLQTMGAGELGVQMLQQLLPDMRRLLNEVLKEFSETQKQTAVRIMEEEMMKTFTAERMVEEIIPIYEKHLSGDEIKAILAFFESPTGRKYISVQPQILRESSDVAEKLSAETLERVQKRLVAEGLDDPGEPPPPKPGNPPPGERRP